MTTPPTGDEPSFATVLNVALLTVSTMTAVMIRFGANPAEVLPITMEIIGLVIGYLISASGRGPELRP